MGTDLNIGHATAYAYAKSKGYTGTEEQFATELAQFAQNAQRVAEDRAAVEQLVDEFLNTTAPAVIQDVTDEGTSQVERVAGAGTAQVTRVGQAGDTQIDAVATEGTTQIGLVTAEGTAQVTRVQDKGDEVIDSIPADYTALTQEVSDLNQAINYFGITSVTVVKSDINDNYPRKALNLIPDHEYYVKLLKIEGDTNYRSIYIYQNGNYLARELEKGNIVKFTPTGTEPINLIVAYANAPVTGPTITLALAEVSNQDTIITLDDAINDIKNIEHIHNYYNISFINLSANGRFPRTQLPASYGHEYYLKIKYIDNDTNFSNFYLNQGLTANTLVPAFQVGDLIKLSPSADTGVYLIALYTSDPPTPPSIIYEIYDVAESNAGISVIDEHIVSLNNTSNVKSVNHRGYSTHAPENTLPAYQLSKLNGYLYAETDVQFTSDNIPVLLHDLSINRTARNADGTTIDGTVNINSITYEQALQYDFGIRKGFTYKGTKIPTFTEFINLCRNIGLNPYVELKQDVPYTQAQIENLVDIVKNYGMLDKTTWISFSDTLITYVRNYEANARIGYLVNTINSAAITTVQNIGGNVFLNAYSENLTDELINLCINAKVPLETWTIDDAEQILALNPYISGITSNNLIASLVLYNSSINT